MVFHKNNSSVTSISQATIKETIYLIIIIISCDCEWVDSTVLFNLVQFGIGYSTGDKKFKSCIPQIHLHNYIRGLVRNWKCLP